MFKFPAPMKIRAGNIPIPDESAALKPVDFTDVLLVIPEECVLIGGQAVAWWAERYGIKAEVKGQPQEITSRDIDFWGTADDLRAIASRLKNVPVYPHRYEMTLLVGAIALEAGGKKTSLEVLHAVPGLDSPYPQTTAVPEEVVAKTGRGKLLVLSPVSLALTKLHALRHFPQDNRQDLLHLLVCLKASRMFIEEILKQDTRLALWNCNRLIDVQRQKPIQKLEQKYRFKILEAVPINSIRSESEDKHKEGCERLQKFLQVQWPRVAPSDEPDTVLNKETGDIN
jgi:hypothetical protein